MAFALLAVLGGAPSAPAEHDRPVPVLPYYPGAYTSTCWQDVRLFHTLRYGYFPYCRERMRYRPGALECSQVTDRICTVIDPHTHQLVEARSPVHRSVIPCPDGPEPPLCRKLDLR